MMLVVGYKKNTFYGKRKKLCERKREIIYAQHLRSASFKMRLPHSEIHPHKRMKKGSAVKKTEKK